MFKEESLHPSVNEESYSVYSWFLVSLVLSIPFETACREHIFEAKFPVETPAESPHRDANDDQLGTG